MKPIRPPSLDSATYWQQQFQANPGAFESFLSDMYAVVVSRGREGRRSGRIPRNVAGSLDEVWDLLTPDLSLDPFPVAMRPLLAGSSLRGFAQRVPMSCSMLSRLMTGAREVTDGSPDECMKLLASIAKAGNRSALYFREYRALYLMVVAYTVFSEHPNTSIGVIRKLESVR